MNKPQEPKPQHERLLEIGSNAAGIVGLVLTVVSGKLVWLLPVIAACAYMVFALKHRRWTSGLVSLVLVVAAAGVGAVGLLHKDSPTAPAAVAQTPNSTLTTAPGNGVPIATPSSSQSSSEPKRLFDGEVTLDRHDSVDVDHASAQITHYQDGAIGEGDIYFNPDGLPGTLLAHGGSTVYLPPTSAADPDTAYAACADQYDPAASDRNSHPFGFIGQGDVMCFKTSEGHLAWSESEAVSQPIASQAAVQVTLRVIVWDK